MALTELHHTLSKLLAKLDVKNITPPVEISVGPYHFYPYRGFSDISHRDDFPKLSQRHLTILIKIAEDILNMRRPELFEAFVNDDGTIVVDKEQPNIEYSMDVSYNDSRSKVEEVFPQVMYPMETAPRTRTEAFIRNDTVHEVTHHADFWIDVSTKKKPVRYLHSSSTLLALCGELDGLLYEDGVAHLIGDVRTEEGYENEKLLEEGYKPERIDAMLRAEFFAIMGEFYFGTKQPFKGKSALLEAYVEHILGLDLAIQNLYISYMEMEKKRAFLREAIHQTAGEMMGEELKKLIAMREEFEKTKSKAKQSKLAKQIEKLVIARIEKLAKQVREKVRLKA